MRTWALLLSAGLLTLGRVILSTLIGTLWAVPVGLAIGLSPRLSRLLQPVVQVAASFPAPMLFPAVIACSTPRRRPRPWQHRVDAARDPVVHPLQCRGRRVVDPFGSARGSQASVSAAGKGCGALLPAILPFLVTGWVTAAGGAWNATIVAEYVTHRGQVLTTFGLGAMVSEAATHADFQMLPQRLLMSFWW